MAYYKINTEYNQSLAFSHLVDQIHQVSGMLVGE